MTTDKYWPDFFKYWTDIVIDFIKRHTKVTKFNQGDKLVQQSFPLILKHSMVIKIF